MKKLAKTSMYYMIFGLTFGVYYRELTKFNKFDGETQLSILHTHALILGMFFFLIILLLEKNFQLTAHKHFKKFFLFYNSGLVITLLIMLIHETIVVLGGTGNAAISGIGSIGHICLTIGLGFFFSTLLTSLDKQDK